MSKSNWISKIKKVVDISPPSIKELYTDPGKKSDYDLIESHKDRLEPKQLKLASVLIGITNKRNPSILLTKRSVNLEQHSGQVAFPGGKVEENENVTEAALREANEEVGILNNEVEVYGYLDTYETGTGFRILPVVALIKENFTKEINEKEVSEIFEAPLDFLFDSSNHILKSGYWNGAVRQYYSIKYNDYNIWGATAGMLINLFDRINKNV